MLRNEMMKEFLIEKNNPYEGHFLENAITAVMHEFPHTHIYVILHTTTAMGFRMGI